MLSLISRPKPSIAVFEPVATDSDVRLGILLASMLQGPVLLWQNSTTIQGWLELVAKWEVKHPGISALFPSAETLNFTTEVGQNLQNLWQLFGGKKYYRALIMSHDYMRGVDYYCNAANKVIRIYCLEPFESNAI
jgi:hypothetical protein